MLAAKVRVLLLLCAMSIYALPYATTPAPAQYAGYLQADRKSVV